jgi:hypothetical protein
MQVRTAWSGSIQTDAKRNVPAQSPSRFQNTQVLRLRLQRLDQLFYILGVLRTDRCPDKLEHQAEKFVKQLKSLRLSDRRATKSEDGDPFMGIPMREVFALAEEFVDMPPGEIEKFSKSQK